MFGIIYGLKTAVQTVSLILACLSTILFAALFNLKLGLLQHFALSALLQ
jgi:hypothetical protein